MNKVEGSSKIETFREAAKSLIDQGALDDQPDSHAREQLIDLYIDSLKEIGPGRARIHMHMQDLSPSTRQFVSLVRDTLDKSVNLMSKPDSKPTGIILPHS